VTSLTTVSIYGSATSEDTDYITAPVGIGAGYLIVLLDRMENNSGQPDLVTPTGFTSIGDVSDGLYNRQNLSYKITDGTEGGEDIYGMSATDDTDYIRKALYVFSGNVAINSATVHSVHGQSTSGDPTSQTVTASDGPSPLVIIAGYSTYYASISPRTFSTGADGEIHIWTDFYLDYKIYNSSPANTSIDMDAEGEENLLQSCYISLSAAYILSLSTGTGSFSLTGKAAIPGAARSIYPAAGSFSLTGQAAIPGAARSIYPAAGSFSLTGQALPVEAGKLPCDVGVFTLTGQPSSLLIYPPRDQYEQLVFPLSRRVVDPKTGMMSGEWEMFLKQLTDGYNELQSQ
jgi:hypothetical protein